MPGIEVVRESDLKKGDSTDGIVRRRAFDSENTIVSRSRVVAGVVSGWRHHRARDLYGFVVNGQLRLESAMNSTGGGRFGQWRLLPYSRRASPQGSEPGQDP